MDFSFNVEMAVKYGVEEAVLLQHLYFWIQKNAANQKHLHDGYYWTYNSAQAFTVIFPFWSRQKVDRMIQSLREQGAIFVGNYNDVGRDRTRWFALSDAVCAIAENRAMHCSELSNPLLKSKQPLPDNKPDRNTDKSVRAPLLPRGKYGYVKLSDEEYQRLVNDLGTGEVERVIVYLDESAAMTENKNRWKNWNLVIRKAAREKWGKRENQAREGRMIELDEKGRLIT